MAEQNDTNTDNADVPTANPPVADAGVPSVDNTQPAAAAAPSGNNVSHSIVHKFIADIEAEIKKFESINSIFHAISIVRAIKTLIADLKSKL